jgi:hypothetical protein
MKQRRRRMAKAQKRGKEGKPIAGKRAVAYYRSDIPDQCDAAILKQQERIRRWARDHGVKIVAEFADRGASKIPSKRAR